jgi:hypothetical protein
MDQMFDVLSDGHAGFGGAPLQARVIHLIEIKANIFTRQRHYCDACNVVRLSERLKNKAYFPCFELVSQLEFLQAVMKRLDVLHAWIRDVAASKPIEPITIYRPVRCVADVRDFQSTIHRTA